MDFSDLGSILGLGALDPGNLDPGTYWGDVPVVNDDDPFGTASSGGLSVSAPKAGSSLLQTLLGTGSGVLGGVVNTKLQQGPQYQQLAQQAQEFAQNLAEQQRQFNTLQANRTAEVQRRNQLFGMVAPGLLSNLGYSAKSIPNVLGAMNPNG